MLIEDKAYIAGLLDGEGSIGFQRSKDMFGNYHIYPRIWVYNTHKPVMLYFQKLYKGKLALQSASKSKPMSKELWRLGFNLKEMTRLLNDVKPYLKIKKIQAELCLEFINKERNKTRDKRGRVKRLSKTILKYRKNLFKRYKKAQRLGKCAYKNQIVKRW